MATISQLGETYMNSTLSPESKVAVTNAAQAVLSISNAIYESKIDTVAFRNAAESLLAVSSGLSAIASSKTFTKAVDDLFQSSTAITEALKDFRVSPSYQRMLHAISEANERTTNSLSLSAPVTEHITEKRETFSENFVNQFPERLKVKANDNQYERNISMMELKNTIRRETYASLNEQEAKHQIVQEAISEIEANNHKHHIKNFSHYALLLIVATVVTGIPTASEYVDKGRHYAENIVRIFDGVTEFVQTGDTKSLTDILR